MEYLPSYKDDLYLEHHGVKGQKWGVRRYQNEDGTRTSLGKQHEAELDSNSESEPPKKNRFNIDKKLAKKIAIGVGVGLAGAALAGGIRYATSGAIDVDRVANIIYKVTPHAEKTPMKAVAKNKPSEAVLDIVRANKEAKKSMNEARKAVKPVSDKLKQSKTSERIADSITKKKGQKVIAKASDMASGKGRIGRTIANYRDRKAYQRAMNVATSTSMADAQDAFSRENIRKFLDDANRMSNIIRSH